MFRFRYLFSLLLLTGFLLSASGCNDDDCPACPENEPEEFQITLTCTDEAGLPLANVVVGAMPGLPRNAWSWDPNGPGVKSSTRLIVELAENLRIRVLIRDVEKNPVQTVVEGAYLAGPWLVMWDGRYGDTYVHTPPGYYEAVLMIDEGEVLGWAAVDSVGLFQAAFDPGQYDYGSTDASGRLKISDRRLIPAFYDLMPLQNVNEEGVQDGYFALTTETWLLCLKDGGPSVWGVFQAVDGPQEVTVVFTEEAPKGNGGPVAPLIRRPHVKRDSRASFGLPVPNPFN